MRIIGHREYGYLIDASCDDVAKITGEQCHGSYGQPSLKVGTEINPAECYRHLKQVIQNESARSAIANQLRAAATVIETTPSPLTLPIEPATK